MSEEIIQKNYEKHGDPFGSFEFYNIGKTSIENLKKYKIVPSKDYGVYGNKSPDALICDRKKPSSISVICVIEHKQPSSFDTDEKRQKAFEQCNNYCQTLEARLGIITDGVSIFWINPTIAIEQAEHVYKDGSAKIQRGFSFIKNDNGTFFKHPFDHSSSETIDTINLLLKAIDKTNSVIRPKNTVSPSTLAKQVWQSVWLATGDDPKKCLMTFTELFIFKFLSDLEVLKIDENGNNVDFDSVLQKGKTHCLKYYLNNVRPYIKKIFPSHDDGTTIINGLSLKNDQNQDGLFFDILTSFNNFGKLENIDPEFKSRLFEDFLKGTTGKKQLAQFFTPRNVIKAMVEIANVKNLPENSKIGDPACGVGGFIIETILNRRTNNKQDFYVDKKFIKSNVSYRGYDFDDLTIILAKANLLITLTELLAENPKMTHEFSELLSNIFVLEDKSIIGSLEVEEPQEYRLIMSNPPYVLRGTSVYRDYIRQHGELSKYYPTTSVGKEGLFVQKILQELARSGEAFVILPDGFFYRPTDNELKKRILDLCYIKCIISLPEKTFYATDKKTYILGLQRKDSDKDLQNFPVFSAIARTIGETLDIYRLRQADNDLNAITREYKYFHADRTGYQNKLQNIKIIPIENFANNLNWLIENYWTIDEKIELGILDDVSGVSDNDLFENIDFFQEKLDEIKKTLEKELNVEIGSKNNHKAIQLTDKTYFKHYSAYAATNLELTKKQYSEIDTGNPNDIPLYSAAKEPVAYIKRQAKEPLKATKEHPHISFATDGESSAGSHIFFHESEYYIKASRMAFEVIADKIFPEYIFYYIQDIKKKYGYDFSHKATWNNISEIEILIPVDESGEFDINAQKRFVEHYLRIHNLKHKIFNAFFKKVKDFEGDVGSQLDSKIKEYFSVSE